LTIRLQLFIFTGGSPLEHAYTKTPQRFGATAFGEYEKKQ